MMHFSTGDMLGYQRSLETKNFIVVTGKEPSPRSLA